MSTWAVGSGVIAAEKLPRFVFGLMLFAGPATFFMHGPEIRDIYLLALGVLVCLFGPVVTVSNARAKKWLMGGGLLWWLICDLVAGTSGCAGRREESGAGVPSALVWSRPSQRGAAASRKTSADAQTSGRAMLRDPACVGESSRRMACRPAERMRANANRHRAFALMCERGRNTRTASGRRALLTARCQPWRDFFGFVGRLSSTPAPSASRRSS
jgi:hypothetical protein